MYILLYRWRLSTVIEVGDSNSTSNIKFTTISLASSRNRIATSSGMCVWKQIATSLGNKLQLHQLHPVCALVCFDSSFKFAFIRGDVAGSEVKDAVVLRYTCKLANTLTKWRKIGF
ncbi:hypothetical protein L2E82_30442 [Cichorium intybus]|uniref:Uncharacterized protein n=1 Tax=Cichorium intybus TaxID=13427 RepID=A0ACB9D0D4_CICIN|nr:hypothetical protein L2E82_30442 [Cichorium intybus]